jgi:hypothetical protein
MSGVSRRFIRRDRLIQRIQKLRFDPSNLSRLLFGAGARKRVVLIIETAFDEIPELKRRNRLRAIGLFPTVRLPFASFTNGFLTTGVPLTTASLAATLVAPFMACRTFGDWIRFWNQAPTLLGRVCGKGRRSQPQRRERSAGLRLGLSSACCRPPTP